VSGESRERDQPGAATGRADRVSDGHGELGRRPSASVHRARRDAAEQEIATTAAHIERVESDYLAGSLSAADYSRLHDKLAAQHQASLDRAFLLAEHERPAPDIAADEILRLVADIRSADTIPAMRTALMTTFESFELRRWADLDQPVLLDLGLAEYALVPTIRPDAIAAIVPVEDEEVTNHLMAIPDTATIHIQSGGTSRY
jgi:hypothetical protein